MSRTLLPRLLLALLCAGCGGGGGGAPQPAAPQPTVTPANQAPIVVEPNQTQFATERHFFTYDASQGGRTFLDPDGDTLRYSVRLETPLVDLRPVGSSVAGVPVEAGSPRTVTIVASDGRGGTAEDTFQVFVNPNASPQVAKPNYVFLTQIGEHVNYDPTQGGATFADSDGDSLTYTVTTIGSPPGLTVVDNRVVGSLTEVGLAAFEIVASDGYGGTVTDKFGVAVAAPEPGRPTLPDTPYTYADSELPLPWEFRRSFEFFAPFWDTSSPDVAGPGAPTNAGATLGRVLFYDKRLSITNTHSCSSCHHQEHNFASPQRFDTGVLGVPMKRNSMALTNARYNLENRYFVDQRTRTLETLVLQPIEEPTELGIPLPMLVEKLAATDFYPPLFAAAFGTPEITQERISHALAQFVRSLISFQSRFDQAFHRMEPTDPINPDAVLTPQERRGEQLFFNFGPSGLQPFGCNSCHDTGLQLMDRPTNNGLDVVSLDMGNAGQFRTASLRNIAFSSPYMHDGRFATLREVIDHYDHGIQDSPLVSPPLRDGSNSPVKRLNLSESDKQALEAFLHTLTDSTVLNDPKFSDPFP